MSGNNSLLIDLINSLASFKAKEAGFFGKAKLDTEDIGVFGAAISDVQETSARYLAKEINREEAKEELQDTISAAVKTFLHGIADKALTPVAEFFKEKWPAFSVAIEGAKEFVKQNAVDFVVDTVKEGVGKVINVIREKLRLRS
ncbi:MAG: hypothetical protein ABSB95_12920 [Dissulfurispiraceae bacterium]|jgi:hypothetical protein